ncbi:MAG: hypothetical protein JWP97_1506 [Labilithrix sp.]|nr:hypothetical protein [Labilithrix sp.]
MEAPSFELAEPFVVQIPRLVTKRLLLREFRPGDFDGYAAYMADPVATKFLAGITDRRNSWRSFASGVGTWALQGKGWWMLETRDTGEVAGTVGGFLRDGHPDVVELGWTVYPQFWRQGIATEAAIAARDFAIQSWNARRLIANIASGNTASSGVAQKLGMTYLGEFDFYGQPCGRWGIDVP